MLEVGHGQQIGADAPMLVLFGGRRCWAIGMGLTHGDGGAEDFTHDEGAGQLVFVAEHFQKQLVPLDRDAR